MKKASILLAFALAGSFVAPSLLASNTTATPPSNLSSAKNGERLQLAWWEWRDQRGYYRANWCDRNPYACHRKWCANHPGACSSRWCANHPQACRERWCNMHPKQCRWQLYR